jgi:hypothetical protein
MVFKLIAGKYKPDRVNVQLVSANDLKDIKIELLFINKEEKSACRIIGRGFTNEEAIADLIESLCMSMECEDDDAGAMVSVDWDEDYPPMTKDEDEE